MSIESAFYITRKQNLVKIYVARSVCYNKLMKKALMKKVSTEDLAMMVSRGFLGMDERFEKMENRFDSFKKETEENFKDVEENFKKIRNDILNIGDRFVPRHEFDTLTVRVGRLEQRVSEKTGR